jgi:hypothetical protein
MNIQLNYLTILQSKNKLYFILFYREEITFK